MKRKTWTLVPLPPRKNLVGCKRIYKTVVKRDQAKLAYLSMQNINISTISTKENKRKENTRYMWFTQLRYVHGKVVFCYL